MFILVCTIGTIISTSQVGRSRSCLQAKKSKMLSVMHEVQTKLGGELLDEYQKPISDTHLNKVYDAL